MRKTKTYECDQKITVDINGLQAMLSVGRNTAAKIGNDAKATIKVGRRTLYNVNKIESYLNNMSA